ncbi:MAG: efflux RND transporter periplasmic adaptor subunit [Tannerellaceae bacterium]|nr:efflux RND transporter periplasmic adaptor subunit [Tannerellaceae bacterium]
MKYYRLIFLLIFAGITGCSSDKNNNTHDNEQVETVLPDAANEVVVISLHVSDFNHELVSNGRLSARKFADLRFESVETIAGIYVKNGERVAKGQKLADLSDFRLKNKTALAKDALDRAKLELQDVLIGQGFVIEDSVNIPDDIMRLARTKSGYDQALASYELALYEERHAVLTAPFDGIVANLFAKPYNLSSTSDVFCSIIDPNSLEASFTILESELSLIKTNDKVEVTPFTVPDGKTSGQISEINPLVDANGMVQAKASVVPSGRLFEGMNVRVSIRRPLKNQLVVPKEAVVLRSGREVAFTLVDGKAFWNYVQTGLENAGYYTIVEGLKEGDILIVKGNVNLAHETTVTVID